MKNFIFVPKNKFLHMAVQGFRRVSGLVKHFVQTCPDKISLTKCSS